MKNLALENIENLKTLWQMYGAIAIENDKSIMLHGTDKWPNRHWLNNIERTDNIEEILRALLPKVKSNAIFATWPSASKDDAVTKLRDILRQNDWQISFTQTAMYLPLTNKVKAMKSHELTLTLLTEPSRVAAWCNIGSKAFNYQISPSVITSLLTQSNVKIYFACIGNEVVGAGMLVHSSKVTGVHQVSVLPEHQGKGYAKAIMQALIQECVEENVEHLVLQASAAGLPLYKKLGFIEQFTIENFVQVENLTT